MLRFDEHQPEALGTASSGPGSSEVFVEHLGSLFFDAKCQIILLCKYAKKKKTGEVIKCGPFQVWYFDGWSGDECSLIAHPSCNRNPNPKKHSPERHETSVLTNAHGNEAPAYSEQHRTVSGLTPEGH